MDSYFERNLLKKMLGKRIIYLIDIRMTYVIIKLNKGNQMPKLIYLAIYDH